MVRSPDSTEPQQGLDHVLRRAALGRTPELWLAASEPIRSQRQAVENMLAAPQAPAVYGFNTFLGQLDRMPAEPAHQQSLLENHLVGPAESASSSFLGTMTACKIEQLRRGGTGISIEAYTALLRTPAAPAKGCWNGSYGSGDVVPAAWWMKTQLWEPLTDSGRSWRAGDLIALINGSFVAAAWGVAALIELVHSAAQFLARYAAVAVLPQIGSRENTSELRSKFSPVPHKGVQAPVSLRDAGPVLNAVETAITDLVTALETRLGQPSGNPLFYFQQGETTALSQSSFMDYRLTFALTQAIQAIHLMAGTTQRIIAYRAASSENQAQHAKIQPPKVAAALVERLRMNSGALPVRFSGSESGGVEDIWDLATLSAEQLLDAIGQLPELFGILDATVQAPAGPECAGEFARILLRRILPAWTTEEIERLAGRRLVP